jgi:hypothetical protein
MNVSCGTMAVVTTLYNGPRTSKQHKFHWIRTSWLVTSKKSPNKQMRRLTKRTNASQKKEMHFYSSKSANTRTVLVCTVPDKAGKTALLLRLAGTSSRLIPQYKSTPPRPRRIHIRVSAIPIDSAKFCRTMPLGSMNGRRCPTTRFRWTGEIGPLYKAKCRV